MGAENFYLPFRPVVENTIVVPGAQVLFTLSGTNTKATVYADGALTTPLSNPVVADGVGKLPDIFLDDAVTYRARVYGRDAVAGVDTPVEEYDPYLPGFGPDDLRDDLAASDGSNNINFIATGTGAATRSLQAKLRDSVSVKDLGAKGDGTTDDSAAFTNAFTSGREVYLPAGNYKITPRTFSGLTSLKVRGAGRDVTKITLSSTGTAFTFSNCQWLQMSDFTLQATGTAQTLASAIGIQLDTGSCNALIQNFILRGFSLDGIRQVGTLASPLSGNTLRDGYILGCGRNQLYGYYNNDFTVDNVQQGDISGIAHASFGMLFDSCGEGAIINTKTWSNAIGYKALNCTGLRHDAMRCELSDNENVWIEGGNDHKFDSACRFFSSSQAVSSTKDNFYAKNVARLILEGDVNTWDATKSKYAVNIDTGCDDVSLKCHQIGGYGASYGPIRIDSSVLRVASDIATQLNGAAVAAASTVYLSGNGSSSAEGAGGRQCHTQLAPLSLIVACVTAPSATKNFTYTLRKNGADTGVTVQISGTATSARINTIATPVTFDIGDWYSVKLVTDSGATVTDHRCTLVMAET